MPTLWIRFAAFGKVCKPDKLGVKNSQRAQSLGWLQVAGIFVKGVALDTTADI